MSRIGPEEGRMSPGEHRERCFGSRDCACSSVEYSIQQVERV